MPTIRQVAHACGVSPMTVSFVINNKPGQVSDETRERVLRVIREMGYRPHASHRTNFVSPSDAHIHTLGMVSGVPGSSLMEIGSYYSSIMSGLLAGADRMSQNVTLFTNSIFHTDSMKSIRIYCDGRCDGLFIIAPNIGSPLVGALQDRGTPFLLIGSLDDDQSISGIDVDNPSAAKQVVEYLIAHGHRRIGFIGGPDFVLSAQRRHQGYLETLAAHHMPTYSEWQVIGFHRNDEVREQILALLHLPGDRPTALFCWNDDIAVRTIQIIQEIGLRVPEDISVIGFDDSPMSLSIVPILTTVRQPYDEIGSKAVEMLLALIADPHIPQRICLPTEIVPRGTVGPPPPN